MKIISWNVNGIKSSVRTGILDFIKKEKADVYCFQEIKSSLDGLSDSLKNIKGYELYYNFAEKKGYSGVFIYSKIKPLSVIKGIGDNLIDKEGRVLALEFKDFFLINAYFPHSNRELKRLDFKLRFNKLFLKFCKNLEEKKPLVMASDFNVAHKEIDLANPTQNKKNAGFTIQERTWFDNFLKKGYIDTFREFDKESGQYTYWSNMHNARERNIGWRIDYFIISKNLLSKIKDSYILKEIKGSDHCPIGLIISSLSS